MWGFLRSSLSWWGLSRGLEMYKYVWYHLSPSGKFVALESSFCLPGCLPPVTSVSGEGGGYGEMVGDPELGLDQVILSELSDKALPGRAASGMTEF